MSQRKIKVLHIGKFYPPPFGGIESVLVSLAEAIKADVQLDIVVSNSRWKTEIIDGNGFTVYKVGCLGTFFRVPVSPFMPYMVKRLMSEKNYDVVHLHFPNPMAHLTAAWLRKKTKVVITWHSDLIPHAWLFRCYRFFLERFLTKAAAVVAATPAHFISSKQLSVCTSKQLHVVPFAVDPEPYRWSEEISSGVHQLRHRYGLEGKPVIFAVGRHVPYKGFEYLIRAMSKIPDAHLLLGGEGPLTPQLKKLAEELALSKKIQFVGKIPFSQLPLYFYTGDVFCMPSIEKSEAFGMVQLEAMLCKKPVVCCELYNGVTYVNQSEKTGLVVPPRDVNALAAALQRLLLDEKLRIEMGSAGYERATKEFHPEMMKQKMMEVYASVLNKKETAH